MKNNSDIRISAYKNNVKMYQIAEKLGIHYVTLNSKLRKELSKDEKERIYQVINEIKEKNDYGK